MNIWLGEIIFLPGAIYLPPIARKYWKGDVSRLTTNSEGIVSSFNRRVGAAIVPAASAGVSGTLMIPFLVLADSVDSRVATIFLLTISMLLLGVFIVSGVLCWVVYRTNKPTWIVPQPFRD